MVAINVYFLLNRILDSDVMEDKKDTVIEDKNNTLQLLTVGMFHTFGENEGEDDTKL